MRLQDALDVRDAVHNGPKPTHDGWQLEYAAAGEVVEKAARLVADASELAGGGDQWIMDWEGELIHPTDLPEGRYLIIPISDNTE